LELVAERGLHGASIESIARRAGVGKATIYRHWETKEELVLDVLREMHTEIPMVNSGNIRDDWVIFMKDIMRIRFSNPLLIQLFFRLYTEARDYPQFTEMLYERFFKERYEHAQEFVEAAKARGEIRKDLDPLLLFTLLGGPMVYLMFLSLIAPDRLEVGDMSEQIVDAILKGIQAQPK